MSESQTSLHPAWLESLRNPETYSHPVDSIQIAETHISWVVLTGDWAYKLKKPVNFGFVNFTTLELRHAACHDEIRLNKRTAPDLYDAVVPLTCNPSGYRFGGTGPTVEFAVRMRQFSQEDLLDQRLHRGAISADVIDVLAHEVASLHQQAVVAPADSVFGSPEKVHEVVHACLSVLAAVPLSGDLQSQLSKLNSWTNQEFSRLEPVLVRRKEQGFVRECHGDLHLGNLVMFHGRPTLFDCLEFNPDLRWIDVISDLAFLFMDLIDRSAEPFAWRILNLWLQQTGDYAGLQMLKYYATYRALVRAKVAALRFQQPEIAEIEMQRQTELLLSYVNLASQMTCPKQPAIYLMHGVSGSGKSFVARELASFLGAIQIRSDVERKRLFGCWPASPNNAVSNPEMYSASATVQTYHRLQDLTREIVGHGYSVVVDAAFLARSNRHSFVTLAHDLGVSVRIVSCTASDETLKQRIRERLSRGDDPSDANLQVLEKQLELREDLTSEEIKLRFCVDTEAEDLFAAFRELSVSSL